MMEPDSFLVVARGTFTNFESASEFAAQCHKALLTERQSIIEIYRVDHEGHKRLLRLGPTQEETPDVPT